MAYFIANSAQPEAAIRAMLDKHLGNAAEPSATGDPRALAESNLDRRDAPFARRRVERRESVHVARADVRAGGKQLSDDLRVSAERGEVQGRELLGVGGVDVRALGKQEIDEDGVPVARRVEQGLGRGRRLHRLRRLDRTGRQQAENRNQHKYAAPAHDACSITRQGKNGQAGRVRFFMAKTPDPAIMKSASPKGGVS